MNPYLIVKHDKKSQQHDIDVPRASQEDVENLAKSEKDPIDEITFQKQMLNEEYNSLQKKRIELQKKEDDLKKKKLRFQTFLQVNEHRRQKAAQKTNENQKLQEELDHELEKLQDRLDKEEEERSKLATYVEQYKDYRDLLQKVVAAAGGEFQEVNDIIKKYKTITSIKKELMDRKQSLEEQLKEQENVTTRKLAEKSDALLQCTADGSKLQEELDRLQFESAEKEELLKKSQEMLSEKHVTWTKLRMAIQSMYDKIGMCNYNRTPCTSDDPVKQLQKIAHFLQKWNEIVCDLQQEDIVSSVRAQASVRS